MVVVVLRAQLRQQAAYHLVQPHVREELVHALRVRLGAEVRRQVRALAAVGSEVGLVNTGVAVAEAEPSQLQQN